MDAGESELAGHRCTGYNGAPPQGGLPSHSSPPAMTASVPAPAPDSSDAIASDIAANIAAQRLPPGAKLPPQRNLAWKLGVTVGTVSRGYMLAEQKGLLSGEVGRQAGMIGYINAFYLFTFTAFAASPIIFLARMKTAKTES